MTATHHLTVKSAMALVAKSAHFSPLSTELNGNECSLNIYVMQTVVGNFGGEL